MFGNGLAWIEADAAGRPVGLHPIPWPYVMPQVLPNGQLAFDVTAAQAPWLPGRMPRRLLAGVAALPA